MWKWFKRLLMTESQKQAEDAKGTVTPLMDFGEYEDLAAENPFIELDIKRTDTGATYGYRSAYPDQETCFLMGDFPKPSMSVDFQKPDVAQ